jgi:hypothetical protein
MDEGASLSQVADLLLETPHRRRYFDSTFPSFVGQGVTYSFW